MKYILVIDNLDAVAIAFLDKQTQYFLLNSKVRLLMNIAATMIASLCLVGGQIILYYLPANSQEQKLLIANKRSAINNKQQSIKDTPQSPSSNCAADVETLTTLLIKNLPSYANRISQRTRRLRSTADTYSSFIAAGRPEFAPLTLGPGEYKPAVPSSDKEQPQQIFITTLERQYSGGKAFDLQEFHWLFLTQTPDGWRLATMFSQIGSYQSDRPPTPPRESSKGIVGQAVSNWLQDCRNGRRF